LSDGTGARVRLPNGRSIGLCEAGERGRVADLLARFVEGAGRFLVYDIWPEVLGALAPS
jgi:hypothetical protein